MILSPPDQIFDKRFAHSESLASEPERFKASQSSIDFRKTMRPPSSKGHSNHHNRVDDSVVRLEKPRASTPQRLHLGVESMDELHNFRKVGSGSNSNIYLDANGHHPYALKAGLQKDAVKDYEAENVLMKRLQSALDSGEMDHLLERFQITKEQVTNHLSLSHFYTQSTEWSPGQWFATAPALYNSRELYDMCNDLVEAIPDSHRKISTSDRRQITNILSAMRDVMLTLALMHELGAAHLDIKLANILVDDHGQGFLIDFGYTRFYSGTSSDKAVGTPDYIAPEVIRRESYDTRADIYSAGICLQNAFLGISTQRADQDSDTGKLHWHKEPFYTKCYVDNWDLTTKQAVGKPILDDLVQLSMPWIKKPGSQHSYLSNKGMTHPDPSRRPTAIHATEVLDDCCQKLGLNKPFSKEKYASSADSSKMK